MWEIGMSPQCILYRMGKGGSIPPRRRSSSSHSVFFGRQGRGRREEEWGTNDRKRGKKKSVGDGRPKESMTKKGGKIFSFSPCLSSPSGDKGDFVKRNSAESSSPQPENRGFLECLVTRVRRELYCKKKRTLKKGNSTRSLINTTGNHRIDLKRKESSGQAEIPHLPHRRHQLLRATFKEKEIQIN